MMWFLVLSIFLADARKLSFKKTCQAFNQAPTKGRTWSLCEGQQFKSPTKEQKLGGMKASNVMKCTPEMTFEQLCCFDYAQMNAHLTKVGPMMLDIVQAGEGAAETNATAFVEQSGTNFVDVMQNDAAKLGKNAKQVTICTNAKPNPPMADGETAVEMGIDCIAHEFTVQEIMASNAAPPETGNIVLNARIMYLVDQGIPLSSVPVCAETVQTCPCTGQPPSSAAKEFLDQREALLKGTSAADSDGAMGAFLQQKGFFSGLQTSGSFVMMQAGGFF